MSSTIVIMKRALRILVLILLLGPSAFAVSLPLEATLLKPQSLKNILDKKEIITNARWDEEDFRFTNAVLIHAPIRIAHHAATRFELYTKLSAAVKKAEFDEKSKTLEVIGEAGGLKLHSWFKVQIQPVDYVGYEVVRGDLTGFIVHTYFYDQGRGRTLEVAIGHIPKGKERFPALVNFAFPTIAEFVLSVATKNLRSFVEEEYNQSKSR